MPFSSTPGRSRTMGIPAGRSPLLLETDKRTPDVYNITATLSATTEVDATWLLAKFMSANLAATGDVSAALVIARSFSATLSATTEVDATFLLAKFMSATLPATGDIDATPQVAKQMAATLTAQADLASELHHRVEVSATLSATGDLSAALERLLTISATLSAEGLLTVTLRSPSSDPWDVFGSTFHSEFPEGAGSPVIITETAGVGRGDATEQAGSGIHGEYDVVGVGHGDLE